MHSGRVPRIIVIGAGFGGVQAVRELSRLFPLKSQAEIWLVDRNDFLLFTPMLIEVMSAQVDMLHIVSPARQLSRRINFLQGQVQHIDAADRRVTVLVGGGPGSMPEEQTLECDHLVIALGSIPNFYGIPGLQENSLTMKSLCDAVDVRNRALALLERADAEPDDSIRKELLTFVVGGGGFSGVETAAALHDLLRNALSMYPHVTPDDIRITIVEALSRLLPELSEGLAKYTEKKLSFRGIRIMLDSKIQRVTSEYLELADGTRVPANTLIWTGGVSPSPVIKSAGCPLGRHKGIIVDRTLAVPDFPRVWALGDCAEIPKGGNHGNYAPTAQNATREGRQVARNIAATLRGKEPKPFEYTAMGELAALGRRSGVASIYGIHLSGFPAWFMWRTVYLMKLPRLAQRARVGIDWALDLMFGREIVEIPAQCFGTGVCPAATGSETEEETHRKAA